MSAITAKASRKMKKYAVLTREPRCFLGSFDFSWEQRKFGEITSKYEDPVPTPHDGYYRLGIRSHAKGTFHSYVAKGQELETAQMHRVAAGNFIVNITFGWEHAVAITDKNDAGKLVSHRFPQFSFAEGMVPEFFRYVIVDEKFRHHLWLASPGGAGRNRVLKLDEMLNYLMRFPSRDEQIKIAEFFRHLDNLITLHQRKCALLFSPFQALISMMFTTSTFSWEQRKVGDLLIERNQQAPMSDEYPLMAFIANEGVAPKGERYDRSALVTDTVNKLYKKTEKGDFIYSSNNLETGSIGLNKYGKACISPVYSIFEPTGIADSDFLGRRLVRKDFINAMVKWRQGVIYGQWRIHESDFLKIEIPVPSVEEQRKIGAYLDQLDNLITLHQRKCISFTGRAGRLISTVNKKRITSSWEQRKLSELTSMHARIGWQNLRTSEFLDSGNYMLITGTDFNDGAINFSTCHYVERERYEQDRNIQIHNGSILITKDGTLGKVAYVQGLSMPATLNAGVFNVQIKDANNVDEKYLFQYLKAPFLMDYVDKKATGGTIKHLNQSILVDFPVILPQRSEQTLIGAFFQQLDNLITLHQRKGKAAVTGCSNDANNSKGVYCKARDFGYKCYKKVKSQQIRCLIAVFIFFV